jgi:hypothetical protein
METNPKDIELTAVKPAGKRQNVDVEITFSTHVGWDGALVLFFSLGIAGLFTYITYLYTKQFQAWHRQWIWLFVVFALMYILLVLKFLFTWKNLATENTVRQQAAREVKQGNRLKRTKSATERAKMTALRAKGIYEKLQMNGQWFLWKLYLSGLLESAQQCVNITTVYLCSLPVAWTSSICFALSVDCFHTVYTLAHKNTPARRDRQVKIDTAIDFLCVVVPLSVMWFAYEVPISISEMLSITLMPTFSMLGKMDDILEEVVYQRSAQRVLKEQTRRSFNMKRRRESVFQQVASIEMAKAQEDIVPRQVRYFVAGSKGMFGFFFFVVAIAHLILKPTGCDEKTWEKGCVNKIPFCKSLFTPTCNCASLHIVNDFTLTALPDSLVDDMRGLRKVFIRNCNLTKLPPRMDRLTEMVDFEISFNRLKAFDVDVLKWEKLNMLLLDYNDIARYNKEVFWTHTELTALSLASNHIQVPTTGIYMPSLTFLHIGENHATINARISKGAFPSLIYLYLNGNILEQFPDESLKDHLQDLGVARCRLTSLPAYLSKFKRMVYLDARDNNITSVDASLKSLIKANDIESYFSGNTVCKDDNSLDCEPLCSKTCWRRTAPNDGFCDIECNTADCKFDGGDCKF